VAVAVAVAVPPLAAQDLAQRQRRHRKLIGVKMTIGGWISAATAAKRRLLSETRGSMTVPAIFFFTILMAFGGLVIDIQRVYGVHGQMQAYVDNVALAAAAELDGLTSGGGAINRAFRAAIGANGAGPLITGSQNFMTNPSLNVLRVTFLSSLDTDPGPLGVTPTNLENSNNWVLCYWENGAWNNNCATDLAKIRSANFVEIRAVPRTVNYVVLPIADAIGQMFGQGPIVSQATVALRATAGYLVESCNSIPLMFCNPNEATQTGAPFVPNVGQMYYAGIETGTLRPADFATIQAFAGNGANEIRQAFARVNPNTFCFSRVKVKPGVQFGPVSQGLNVRLDVYDGSMSQGETSDPEYRPAPNVLKGYVAGGNACNLNLNNDESEDSIPFPRDNCFMNAVPGGLGGTGCVNVNSLPKMGNGNWARAEYWSQNHPTVNPPTATINGVSYIDPINSPIGGWTRYQTYRYEIDNNLFVDPNRDESAVPACYSGSVAPSTDPDLDRRVVVAAVVNCVADNARLNGNIGVPAKIYAKLFLTEIVASSYWDDTAAPRPAGLDWKDPPSNSGIWAEMIGIVPPNEEVLHVYPVLYR